MNNKGFSLIELLTTVVMISILASVSFASFVNQANKARQAEAKVNVGSILRAQQAYVTEKLEFAELDQLELGIRDTENYTYTSRVNGTEAIIEASPVRTLRGYSGRVWIAGTILEDNSPRTETLICEGEVGFVPVIDGLEECQ